MKIKSNIGNLNNYKTYLKIESAVHEFMQNAGYLKADVPVLSPALIPESYLEIFETKFNYIKRQENLYLTPSPELFLKRLLTQGVGDIYYLGKSFRNGEPNSSYHLPEFTMLEFYRIGYTYLQLADEILELFQFISESLRRHSGKRSASRIVIKKKDNDSGQARVTTQKNLKLDNWEKFTVAEAFEKYCGIREKELYDGKLFLRQAKEKGYKTEGFTYSDIFSQMIAQEVEPKLGINGHPALLYDYPKEMASLAKLNRDGRTAKRVEFYIQGIEIGGCCEELNDWGEQETRFKEQETNRKKNGMINHTIDKGFIEALKYGLPDCTGAGIGFERLAMIFANVDSVDKLKLINII